MSGWDACGLQPSQALGVFLSLRQGTPLQYSLRAGVWGKNREKEILGGNENCRSGSLWDLWVSRRRGMRLDRVARDCQYGVGHLLIPVELSHVAPGNDA